MGLSSNDKMLWRLAAVYAQFNFCHCFESDAAIILWFFVLIFLLATITISSPFRASLRQRKLSLINRFSLFLLVASRTFLFEIAVPSLAISRPFGLHKITKLASTTRFVDLKTSEKSVGFTSLCFLVNLCHWAGAVKAKFMRPASSCL